MSDSKKKKRQFYVFKKFAMSQDVLYFLTDTA